MSPYCTLRRKNRRRLVACRRGAGWAGRARPVGRTTGIFRMRRRTRCKKKTTQISGAIFLVAIAATRVLICGSNESSESIIVEFHGFIVLVDHVSGTLPASPIHGPCCSESGDHGTSRTGMIEKTWETGSDPPDPTLAVRSAHLVRELVGAEETLAAPHWRGHSSISIGSDTAGMEACRPMPVSPPHGSELKVAGQ